LTVILAALVIANALGITGWTVNTVIGLEINLPELAWAAGAECEPDGECNADNESDCTANGCCAWEDDPGKGGDPFCYCHCDPDEPYCIDGKCEECRNDGDCDGDKPYCHSSKKMCVECRENNDCSNQRECEDNECVCPFSDDCKTDFLGGKDKSTTKTIKKVIPIRFSLPDKIESGVEVTVRLTPKLDCKYNIENKDGDNCSITSINHTIQKTSPVISKTKTMTKSFGLLNFLGPLGMAISNLLGQVNDVANSTVEFLINLLKSSATDALKCNSDLDLCP
jgi:hypothetical protein